MPTIGVSLPVPEPYASRLTAARRRAADPLADAVPPHITLMPPTVIDDAQVAPLERHLCAVAGGQQPFEMTLRGTGTFRPVSPVVFAAVAEGISQCEQLEQAVRSGPVTRHLEFNYHPHVTIAHHVPDAALDQAFDALAGFHARFRMDGLDLYEHGADGVWRSVRSYAFTGRCDRGHKGAPNSARPHQPQ